MAEAEIGIIGGSGFYEMDGLSEVVEVEVDTPFGPPSDLLVVGTLAGRRVAFLSRHARGHRYTPTEVPSQANIYALKSLGVQTVVAISAVGSMKEEIAPLHVVVPNQLFDRTVARPRSFFGSGIVGHIPFAHPYCDPLRQTLLDAGREEGATIHDGGTYVCIEGPQFSTLGESLVYRQWGMTVVGMTAIPEAKLAREAEMCYATLALVTDYDSWHPEHDSVTVQMVIANSAHNTALAKRIVRRVVAGLDAQTCGCTDALANAVMTDPALIPAAQRAKLGILLDKYYPEAN